jgi:mono/diheme cytochrome c family protein
MLKAIRVNALVLVAAFAPFACAQDSGEELYKANCSTCHGLTGEADTPAGQALKARSLKSPEVQEKSDAQLLAIAKKGKGQMPPWGDVLTDSQLKNVIAYIHTLQKSKIEAGSSAIDPAAAGSGKQ